MKEKAKNDLRLDAVVKGWALLPEHVRVTVFEVVGFYASGGYRGTFETPAGADWSDVEMVLTGTEAVRITVGSVSRTYTFAMLGLASRKDASKPTREWRMLRTYAENPEPDAYYRLPYRRNLKMEISLFRKWLKRFFGIAGDPLRPFKTGLWRPRFRIRAEW